MRNIQEFEEEWKDAASEEGVTDFYVSMSGSWSEQHKKRLSLLHSSPLCEL